MRKLLSKRNAWVWLEEHERNFERLKQLLCSNMVIQPYDAHQATFLITDASRTRGLGYALMQKDAEGRMHMVQCGSCSLSETQQRYATIELEMLAIEWAARKCRYYLAGCPNIRVLTDHLLASLRNVFTRLKIRVYSACAKG